MEDEKISIKTTSQKCPCINCAVRLRELWGGSWSWRCPAYPHGKPEEVLYDNKPCDEFEPMEESDEIDMEEEEEE